MRIGIVVAHLLIFPGLLICSQIFPANIPNAWRFCIAYAQCALLAVFAAFSRDGSRKRCCLFFAGLVYVALMQMAGDLLAARPIPLPLLWRRVLDSLRFHSNFFALMTCGTVVAWLPIRCLIDVRARILSRQFGLRQLFTITFLTAVLMIWYRLAAFGIAPFAIDIWEVVAMPGLINMAALGCATALLSSKFRWLGIAIIALSLPGLAVRGWVEPRGSYYVQFVIGTLGIIAVTILLWRLARIPNRAESVASSPTSVGQTDQSNRWISPNERPLV